NMGCRRSTLPRTPGLHAFNGRERTTYHVPTRPTRVAWWPAGCHFPSQISMHALRDTMPFMHTVVRRIRCFWLSCVLALGVVAHLTIGPAVHADDDALPHEVAVSWERISEEWYAIELLGRHAGWKRITIERSEGSYRTLTETTFRLQRAGQSFDVTTTSASYEHESGQPYVMSIETDHAGHRLSSTWSFMPNRKAVIHLHNGHRVEDRDVPKGVWLMPRAAARYVSERANAGAQSIDYRAVDPRYGLEPFSIRRVRLASCTFVTDDREIPVTKWRVHHEYEPFPIEERISADGVLVQRTIRTGFGSVTLRLTDRESARNVNHEDGPPDLLVQAFVQSERPISNVREKREAAFRIRAIHGELPDVPNAGAQRILRADDDDASSFTVRIVPGEPLAACGDDHANDAYRRATRLVNFDHPRVKRMAQRLRDSAGEDAPPGEIATRARALVFEHLTEKSLETSLVSAAEAARMKAGDCSAHAILLAALLRANDIPSRIAIGLTYVEKFGEHENVFAWHLWTQALIDGRWIDLDATLPGRSFHPGYVLIATSAMSHAHHGMLPAATLMMMGNLTIEPLSTTP
ncbi:MAG: hypothetical protein EA377_12075, partial [Phycisphaerales bacterium]